jgi:hypothetical protein
LKESLFFFVFNLEGNVSVIYNSFEIKSSTLILAEANYFA